MESSFGATDAAFFRGDDLPQIPVEFEHAAWQLLFCGLRTPKLAPEVDNARAKYCARG